MQYVVLRKAHRARRLMLSVRPVMLGKWRQVLRALRTRLCPLPTQHKLAAMRRTRESIACSRPLNGSNPLQNYERRWRYPRQRRFFWSFQRPSRRRPGHGAAAFSRGMSRNRRERLVGETLRECEGVGYPSGTDRRLTPRRRPKSIPRVRPETRECRAQWRIRARRAPN